ncbi:MAG: hypothetical protein CMF42_02465 [Legionellales bacterium]|nr:hypothetical protein [Legionellales bacterium]|tara:strand:- start:1061 stop:1684 length:624 start_codon:yes stop_codon:yes gene_type:complete
MKIIDINHYHPTMNQLNDIVSSLTRGEVVIIPTDTFYCACCIPSHTDAVKLLVKLQHAIDKQRPLTFLCNDISQASELMRVDTMHYRILNAVVPASITFLLPAHIVTLRRLKMKMRTAVGVRIPNHSIVKDILRACGSPLLIQSLESIDDNRELLNQIAPFISYWLKTYYGCQNQPSTIIDMQQSQPKLIRAGQDIEKIQSFIDLYH